MERRGAFASGRVSVSCALGFLAVAPRRRSGFDGVFHGGFAWFACWRFNLLRDRYVARSRALGRGVSFIRLGSHRTVVTSVRMAQSRSLRGRGDNDERAAIRDRRVGQPDHRGRRAISRMGMGWAYCGPHLSVGHDDAGVDGYDNSARRIMGAVGDELGASQRSRRLDWD